MNDGEDGVKRDARKSRWRGHREQRRAEMVDAAVRAIRARGAGVGMDEIAAEAGVTKPVLYRLFDDKADLYVAVGQFFAGQLLGRLQPALTDEHETRDRVAGGVGMFLGAIEDDPELYRFVVSRRFLDKPPDPDPVADFTALIGAALARILGDGARARGLDSGAAEPWGHGLVGLLQSTADWWLRQDRPISRPALTEYLTSLVWDGIAGVIESPAAARRRASLSSLPAEGSDGI